MTNDSWLSINNWTEEEIWDLYYEHKITIETAIKMVEKIWKINYLREGI